MPGSGVSAGNDCKCQNSEAPNITDFADLENHGLE